jgi:hypothetical protein
MGESLSHRFRELEFGEPRRDHGTTRTDREDRR